MPRWKKTILLLDSNGDRLAERKILIETRGYRALATPGVESAFGIIAATLHERPIDLLWCRVAPSFLRQTENLMRKAKIIHPEIRTLLTLSGNVSLGLTPTHADAFLHGEACAPANILHVIRTLTTRKRGPKKRPPTPTPSESYSRSAA